MVNNNRRQFLLDINSVIQEQGWDNLAVDLTELGNKYDMQAENILSKNDLIRVFIDDIQQSALVEFDPNENNIRDKLFDIIMACFEAAAPYKSSINNITCYMKNNPCDVVTVTPLFINFIRWLFYNVGLQKAELTEQVKLRLFGILLLYIFYIWLDDRSAGLATTMAKLDNSLDKFDSFIGL